MLLPERVVVVQGFTNLILDRPFGKKKKKIFVFSKIITSFSPLH